MHVPRWCKLHPAAVKGGARCTPAVCKGDTIKSTGGLRSSTLLLREQSSFVVVNRRMPLSKPPLSNESEIPALGFLNQTGALVNELMERVWNAGVDLFFLTHG